MNDRSSALPQLAGAVLVGGESRRFGRPKQLASWRGRSLVEHVVDALAAVVDEVVLVGEGELPAALAGLRRCADAPRLRGPLAGILGVLRAEPARAWLVAACDQPLLTPEALRWLIAKRHRGAIAVVARRGGDRIEPLPGLFEPDSIPALVELARSGASLQPLGLRSDVVAANVPAELAAAWTSVDSEALLAAIEAR